MKSKLLFLASILLFLLGIGCLAAKWNGTANVNVGFPLSANTVQFCGSASGGWALAGIVSVVLALVVFVVATLRGLTGTRQVEAK